MPLRAPGAIFQIFMNILSSKKIKIIKKINKTDKEFEVICKNKNNST